MLAKVSDVHIIIWKFHSLLLALSANDLGYLTMPAPTVVSIVVVRYSCLEAKSSRGMQSSVW